MSVTASIKNGQVVETASQSSLSSTKSSGGDMDKEAFLQLLVAEMQNQDPLEPTSNTEYITQYAQFSEVESLTNMASTMDLTRASNLVGKEVYIKTTDSSGKETYVQGKVDYVVYENNKAYLSIDESLYSLDDLDTVVDSSYLSASNKVYDFTVELNKLPAVNNISISIDGSKIDSLKEIFDAFSDYEKRFVTSENSKKLEQYVTKLNELRATALTSD